LTIKKAVYGSCENEAYISRVALDTKQACELVDAGFEYVTGEYSDGGKIFRKLKRLFDAAESNLYSGKMRLIQPDRP
jgi:hypothetical protein